MTTPTLSMQLFGEQLRREELRRRRSEAAKKAWRTRRRLAKPSPTMRALLAFLASSEDARLSLHYCGSTLYYVHHWCINPDGSHGPAPHLARTTRTTFLAMEKRGWLEYVRRRESGGTVGELPDGKRGVVESDFDLDYRISAKGRKALTQ